MKANPDKRTFELLEPAGLAAWHEPFEANVNVAEQLVQADDEQTAQFDEQAWHPETAVTKVGAH